MPKFKKDKKVIRKQVGGYPTGAVQQRGTGRGSVLPSFDLPFGYPTGAIPGGARRVEVAAPQPSPASTVASPLSGPIAQASAASQPTSVMPAAQGKKKATTGRQRPVPEDVDQWEMDQYMKSLIDASKEQASPAVDPLAGLPSRQLPSMTRGMRFDMPEGEQQELESMMRSSGASGIAGEIPKTKAGLKKFMQEYGKFIALGAMAGQGGRGGQVAAPIIAALPGLIEMMKGKKSSKSSGAPKSSVQTGMAHGGSVGKKSSGGEPPKKSEGGAIRKFKGGSMKGNSMDSMLTPKYAKGGKMDKMGKTDKMGKAAGEMPQHKKMAMGKPTPQSTGQKFAKGGTMKCATGGGVKGYGIAKKIRPTGPMN